MVNALMDPCWTLHKNNLLVQKAIHVMIFAEKYWFISCMKVDVNGSSYGYKVSDSKQYTNTGHCYV